MAARKTEPLSFTRFELKMKGSTTIDPGQIVCTDAAGFAVPGAVDDALNVQGVAVSTPKNTYVNDGADGAAVVVVQGSVTEHGRTCYWFTNAASGDAVTQAEVGKDVYINGPSTVTKTATDRSIAGKCRRVDATKGVLVEFPH